MSERAPPYGLLVRVRSIRPDLQDVSRMGVVRTSDRRSVLLHLEGCDRRSGESCPTSQYLLTRPQAVALVEQLHSELVDDP